MESSSPLRIHSPNEKASLSKTTQCQRASKSSTVLIGFLALSLWLSPGPASAASAKSNGPWLDLLLETYSPGLPAVCT